MVNKAITFEDEKSWLEARLRGTDPEAQVAITASDIAIIMGNDQALKMAEKYNSTLFDIADKKTSEVVIEKGNLSQRCGSAIEPVIIERFQEEHPQMEVITPPKYTMHIRDKWMTATPDSYADNGLLECKWTGFWMWDESKLGDYLDYYQWQCRWQMAVCERPFCYLRWIIRFPRKDQPEEGEHLFERDMEMEEQMIEQAKRFRQLIIDREQVGEDFYAGF